MRARYYCFRAAASSLRLPSLTSDGQKLFSFASTPHGGIGPATGPRWALPVSAVAGPDRPGSVHRPQPGRMTRPSATLENSEWSGPWDAACRWHEVCCLRRRRLSPHPHSPFEARQSRRDCYEVLGFSCHRAQVSIGHYNRVLGHSRLCPS